MQIEKLREVLLKRVETSDSPREVLRAAELRDLYAEIPKLPSDQRKDFGQQINKLKNDLEEKIVKRENAAASAKVEPIDITAPFDINSSKPELLPATDGTVHPLSREIQIISDIFARMGFDVVESRQLDDDYHMFTSLNFPPNHPARDNFDTFWTEDGFVAPAHTSTMQNRILKANKKKLEEGGQIAGVSIGRVFRNEDIDATHEHTFYQHEGIFVSRDATLGQMLGVLRSFFETYYAQKLRVRTQPSYFPFVEPGLEFAIEKPAALGGAGKGGEWLEMLGCGMIHPNVLKEAGIDPTKYRGFAWGGGVERLVMLKYNIEDLRHFESGKLAFLRKFR
ncbi:phenylalanine--tRNA ligase subunit alpha [Candidatus Saccharibacteria bacterium]|nr:phenylalanine--tRNA ligase subunit alpha [Candidatus Saccharibacteria bacterium]